jgi:hypothetical protein
VAGWGPQLVIHDNRELAGPLAAAEAGLPYVNHGVGASFPLDLYGRVAEATAFLWEAQGIDPGPLGGCSATSTSTSSRRRWGGRTSESSMWPSPCVRSRSTPWPTTSCPPGSPASVAGRSSTSARQGTSFNRDVAVFAPMLDGCGTRTWTWSSPSGRTATPPCWGPQPENVRVERYLAQSLLFPLCDLVVTHGGGGTTLAALNGGIPLLIVPQGGDQFLTAERACAAGVARSVTELTSTPRASAGRSASSSLTAPIETGRGTSSRRSGRCPRPTTTSRSSSASPGRESQ